MMEDEKPRWYESEMLWLLGLLVVAAVVAGVWFLVASATRAEQNDAARAAVALGEPLSEDGLTVVRSDGDEGWAALAESASGDFFMATSVETGVVQVEVPNVYDYSVYGAPTLPSGTSLWELVSHLLAAQDRGGFYTNFTLAGDDPAQTVFAMHPSAPDARIESVEWEMAGLTRACATVTVASDVQGARFAVTLSGGAKDGFIRAYANRSSISYSVSRGFGFSTPWYFERGTGNLRELVGVLTSTSTVSVNGSRSFTVCATGLSYDFPSARGTAVEAVDGFELRTESQFPRVVTAEVPGSGFLPECLTERSVGDATLVTSCSNRPVAAGDPLPIFLRPEMPVVD